MIQLNTALIPNGHFYVAVSGGVDSIVAAHLLWRLSGENKDYPEGTRMQILHYNHKTRPQNDDMQEAVGRFCDSFKIIGTVYSREVGRPTDEASMRKDRMKQLSYHCFDIVMAHHLDDAVESYVMNMITGTPEHTPIPWKTTFHDRRNGIIHPFLRTSKQDFIDYAERHDLMQYVCEDETNKDSSYGRRNYIRNEVIPKFNGMGLPKVVLKKFYL